MVGIIDYGCGNIKSVQNALEYCGYRPVLIKSPADLSDFKKIILPGVGAFDHAMSTLDEHGYRFALKRWVLAEDNILLGICLGMQLLCRYSQESKEGIEGLGIIDATVNLLRSDHETRLPNIGWSEVHFASNDFIVHDGDYYFVHSYGVHCTDAKSELGYSYYGDLRFSSVITNGKNVFGCQFHPEKSHKKGLTLLNSFCAI